MNELDHELIMLKTKLKEKDSEIAKWKAKVSNQSKTNSDQQKAMNKKCQEIESLKKEVQKHSNQNVSQVGCHRRFF